MHVLRMIQELCAEDLSAVRILVSLEELDDRCIHFASLSARICHRLGWRDRIAACRVDTGKLSALKCLPEIKSSTRTGSQLNSFPFRRYDGVFEDVESPGGAATVWSSIVVTRLAGSGRLVPGGGARRSRRDNDMESYRGTTRQDQKRSSGSSLDSCTRQNRDECSLLCIGITSYVRDLASALAETCGERPSAHSGDVGSGVRSLAEPIERSILISAAWPTKLSSAVFVSWQKKWERKSEERDRGQKVRNSVINTWPVLSRVSFGEETSPCSFLPFLHLIINTSIFMPLTLHVVLVIDVTSAATYRNVACTAIALISTSSGSYRPSYLFDG